MNHLNEHLLHAYHGLAQLWALGYRSGQDKAPHLNKACILEGETDNKNIHDIISDSDKDRIENEGGSL